MTHVSLCCTPAISTIVEQFSEKGGFVALAAEQESPTPTSTKSTPYQLLIGGFYVDPNHWKNDGSSAGIRVAGFPNDSADFALTGSDDGKAFWRVEGRVEGSVPAGPAGSFNVVANFSSKGGPADFHGVFSASKETITWQDGNVWRLHRDLRLVTPEWGGSDFRMPHGFMLGVMCSLFIFVLCRWCAAGGGRGALFYRGL